MKRIAFRLPADGVWTGGVNYLETVCRALLAHSDLGYEPVAFCNSGGDPKLLARFESLLGTRLVCDPAIARGGAPASRGRWRLDAIIGLWRCAGVIAAMFSWKPPNTKGGDFPWPVSCGCPIFRTGIYRIYFPRAACTENIWPCACSWPPGARYCSAAKTHAATANGTTRSRWARPPWRALPFVRRCSRAKTTHGSLRVTACRRATFIYRTNIGCTRITAGWWTPCGFCALEARRSWSHRAGIRRIPAMRIITRACAPRWPPKALRNSFCFSAISLRETLQY